MSQILSLADLIKLMKRQVPGQEDLNKLAKAVIN